MKKILSFALALALVFTLAFSGALAATAATPNASAVLVNGKSVSFEAYTIGENNYFKLRDLAKALNGTEKQFEVGWDGANNAISLTTGQPYTSVGGELTRSGVTGVQSAELSTSKVFINGVQANLTAYLIGRNNYFKLRDVGAAINFDVQWAVSPKAICIFTAYEYTSEDTAAHGKLVVHYIDVGQADAEFIELPDKETMLIDAGNSGDGPNIVKYIKAHGYSKITYLIATHPHEDHIGGMAYVVNNLDIGSVYMPKVTTTTQTFQNLLEAIKAKGLPIQTAKAGVSLKNTVILSVKMLAPNSAQYDDLNNYSAVIKINFKNNSFLFMGDAETLSENEITSNVKADVLKVGDHGGASSTGDAFLKKVHPSSAVISFSSGNDYGQPAQSTLDKLDAMGMHILQLDKTGTIVMTSDGLFLSAAYNTPSAQEDGGTQSVSVPIAITSVDKVGEIVKIRNKGTTDVNLQGWVLVSVTGNQRFTFPNYTLKAGAMVTVASGEASGDFKWTTDYIWQDACSDIGELYNAAGTRISSFGGLK